VTDAAREELAALVHGLAAEVERTRVRGVHRVTGAARPPATLRPTAPPQRPAARPAPTPAAPTPAAPEPSGGADLLLGGESRATASAEAVQNRERAGAAADLCALRDTVAACRACELARTRTQTVFADGPGGGTGSTRVLFVGEAPGQHEDEQGVPFVGRAGQLLTDIIEKGMGLRREDVTIANVLKCRPPGNRDPTGEEKARCTPFLDRQIELVDPEVIIPLGLHATQHLLSSTASMGRLRGRVHDLGGRKVVPTYHPAYLLRSPGMKKECWKDIQVAMRELGLSRPT
jgi:DNA polymerase